MTKPRIPHLGFWIACILIVVLPIAFRYARTAILSGRNVRHLIILQGEKPRQTNIDGATARFPKKEDFFGKRSIELDTAQEKDGGYYLTYVAYVPRDGAYTLFAAGTPPGPSSKGSPWHSPYSLEIDGGPPTHLTEESVRQEWPYVFQYSYTSGGYYFTKIYSGYFERGDHTFTLRVNARRPHDGHFTLYLDALIIAPSEFRPPTRVGKMPKDLFYD